MTPSVIRSPLRTSATPWRNVERALSALGRKRFGKTMQSPRPSCTTCGTLCLRTRAPLIPCAIIGGEEASPLLYRFDALADLLRIPYLPVTPTFPALGALGLVPAPTKWRIKFGEPIKFDNYGPEAADDDLLVGRLSERVRTTIQSMLENGLQKRRSVWF